MSGNEVNRIRDDVRFWCQITGDAQRTLICTPDDAPRIRQAIADADAGHAFTVAASLACPPGQVIVVDTPALEAANRAALQRTLTDLRFGL